MRIVRPRQREGRTQGRGKLTGLNQLEEPAHDLPQGPAIRMAEPEPVYGQAVLEKRAGVDFRRLAPGHAVDHSPTSRAQLPEHRLEGLAADHVGEQIDTDFGTFANVTLPAYTLVSGRFAYAVNDRLELYVRGDNLLDEEYRDVVGYAAPGRGLYVGLRLGG